MELVCLQVDLARQKENLSYLKSYLRFAKDNGYNAVLLYLENAVRTEATAYFDEKDTYSLDEMRELVAYSQRLDLELIPAFENLGHLEKFFAYPQLAKFSECADPDTVGRWFDSSPHQTDCGCPTNAELYAFMDEYIRDVCSVFPGKYVHMGLDEPFDFAVCKNCLAELAKGKTRTELFEERVLHNYALARSMGKRMMMWDDFFEYADVVERLPRDIVFCTWNYQFVPDEPYGHWTNRRKRDWFAYYDELGFDYMFCPYLNGSSVSYVVESYTRYATKYKPFGALMTAWEKMNRFYLGGYPLIAYAGRLWSGKIRSSEEKLQVYTEILGSEERAELADAIQVPYYSSGRDYTQTAQNDFSVLHTVKNATGYGLKQMKKLLDLAEEGLQKDIFTDLYDEILQKYLGMKMDILATEAYDNFETRRRTAEYFDGKLDEIALEYARLEQREITLWKKYREGIESNGRAFENKFVSMRKKIEDLKRFVRQNEGASILYVDLGIHEAFGTPRGRIEVKYQGETERTVYQGSMKPYYVSFDVGGTYTLRFVLEKKPIEWITFGVYGEGEICPMHFRYTQNGKKYVAAQVETLRGRVTDAEKVLYDDTRCAAMGYDDGVAHFEDVSLAREVSEIRIKFEPLEKAAR